MKKKIKNFISNNYLIYLNIYLVSIFLKSSTIIIDYPILYNVERWLRVGAFLMMIARCIVILPDLLDIIIKPKWKDKTNSEKIIIILFFALGLAILVNTLKINSIRLISILLVIISSYGISTEKILKNLLALQLSMTVFIISSSVLGLTQDYKILRENSDIVRHSLGFTYTTNLSQIVLFMSLIYCYLKNFKINIYELLMLQLLNIFTYYLTDSKTEILGFECVIIICLLLQNRVFQKFVPTISKISTKLYIFIPILSLVLVLFYPIGGVMNIMTIDMEN